MCIAEEDYKIHKYLRWSLKVEYRIGIFIQLVGKALQVKRNLEKCYKKKGGRTETEREKERKRQRKKKEEEGERGREEEREKNDMVLVGEQHQSDPTGKL
jgi:hypothetical protein